MGLWTGWVRGWLVYEPRNGVKCVVETAEAMFREEETGVRSGRWG